MDKDLEHKLKSCLQKVVPFSDAVQAILKKLNEVPVDINAVADLMECDPILTSSLLRLANSPFYGFSQKITHVDHAVILLGVHTVRQVVMAFSVVKRFSRPTGSGLDRHNLWRHCIGVAVAAKILARRCEVDEEDAFIAGMLHDIGKFIIDECSPDLYQQIFSVRDQQGMSLRAAELQVMGISHGRVGAVAIRFWRLPEMLAEVADKHHQPGADEPKLLVDLVHLANIVVQGLWISPDDVWTINPLDPESLQRLKLEWTDIETLLPEIEEMSHEIIARFLP